MKSLAIKITSFFIEKEIIESTKKEMCEYVIHTKLNLYLILTVILSISIPYDSFIETAIYLIIVLSLRKNLGGYHADTEIMCFLLSVFSTFFIVNMVLPILIDIDSVFVILTVIILTIMMITLKPTIHYNLKMTNKEKAANKLNANKKIIFLFIISIMLFAFNVFNEILTLIALSEFMVVSFMFLAKIFKQEESAK